MGTSELGGQLWHLQYPGEGVQKLWLTLLLPQRKGQQEKRGEPASKWPLSWKNNNRRLMWGPLPPKPPPHSPKSHTDWYNHSITFWKGSLKDHIFFQSQRTRVRGVSLCEHTGSTTGKHLWSLPPVSPTVQNSHPYSCSSQWAIKSNFI